MKYVIFKNRGNLLLPVMFPDHVTHSQVKVLGARPVSAGFYKVGPLGGLNVNTFGKSESLGLEPKERDGDLIYMSLENYPTSSFLDHDNDYPYPEVKLTNHTIINKDFENIPEDFDPPTCPHCNLYHSFPPEECGFQFDKKSCYE